MSVNPIHKVKANSRTSKPRKVWGWTCPECGETGLGRDAYMTWMSSSRKKAKDALYRHIKATHMAGLEPSGLGV